MKMLIKQEWKHLLSATFFPLQFNPEKYQTQEVYMLH